jgi:hypothetical protein
MEVVRQLQWAAILFLALMPARAADLAPAKDDSIRLAIGQLYNFDFPKTHELLNRHIAENPEDPLGYAMRAAAWLFYELDRLGVLEAQFLLSDKRIIDKRQKQAPDPAAKAEMYKAIDEARQRAEARLARDAGDRRALFSLCVVSGIETDYVALIEKRQWGSLSYAKRSQAYAVRLLKLDPSFYDAYLTAGVSEYLLGSLPFFLRWFVTFDQVEGSKHKAIDNLEMAAKSGRYLGPFAKILLAIIYQREKRPEDSERMLREFQREYPANPLVKRELVRLEGAR